MDYDVIVAGAGPAGSSAAAVLAQSGLHTLLIDREGFPREKACGDAVPSKGIRLLQEIGMQPFTADELYPVKKVLLRGPRGAELKFALTEDPQFNSSIVSRYVFDNAICQHAISCGAEYRTMSASAPILENGRVVGIKAKAGKQEVELRSKMVIAADGATSVIARALSGVQRSESQQAVALRGYLKTDIDLDPTIEFIFSANILPGYAWFFPMGKRIANVGIGMRADFYKRQSRSLPEALQIYLDSPEVRALAGKNKIENLKSWPIPLFSFEQKRIFNGALLIGDAGGFVSPLTGAGIYPALVTGTSAAKVAVEAIRVGDVSEKGLAAFEGLWRKDLEGEMKGATFLHKILSAIPSLIDVLIVAGRAVPPLVPVVIGKT